MLPTTPGRARTGRGSPAGAGAAVSPGRAHEERAASAVSTPAESAAVAAPPRGPVPGALSPKPPSSTPAMTPATAQRRVSWNVACLLLLYILPLVWPGVMDVYYSLLEALVQTGTLPDGADEVLDAALAWVRYALTIVFVFNVIEAMLVRPAPRLKKTQPTAVGEALARSVSSGSPLTRPDVARTAAGTTATGTAAPRSPHSPSPRQSSPLARTSSTPYSLGKGRATTPFRARTPSRMRTPSHADVYARTSHADAARPRSSPGARAEWDDQREVDRALQQLQGN